MVIAFTTLQAVKSVVLMAKDFTVAQAHRWVRIDGERIYDGSGRQIGRADWVTPNADDHLFLLFHVINTHYPNTQTEWPHDTTNSAQYKLKPMGSISLTLSVALVLSLCAYTDFQTLPILGDS